MPHRFFVSLAFAMMLVVSLETNAQPQAAATWQGDPFEPDSIDLKAGEAANFTSAARNAWSSWNNLAPGQCPKPKITVTVRKGDPTFQAAVAATKREILQDLLGANAGRFTWIEDSQGAADKVEIDASVSDAAAPAITVDPPSGTKVKRGQRLTIKVTAAEPESGWQSGIRRIQVEDVEQHTNLQLWTNPASPPAPCANAGLTRTIEATGQVPDKPTWRLRVTALDYANNQTVLPVNYPTGDVWQGSIRLERDGRTEGCSAVRSETTFTITVDEDGKVSGSGTLDHSGYTCVGGYTAPATHAPVTIGGKKDNGTFTLFLSDWPQTAPVPRLPIGHWVVPVGQGSTGSAEVPMGGMRDVVFRVRLKCESCDGR